MQNRPLVSIITVVYNGEQFLEQTIQSVINQTYDNIEYIIIDGDSTDGTLEIIKKYENQIDYWVSEKDYGISDAFNKGIASASENSYILMLNAGDVLCDSMILEEIVPELNQAVISGEVVNNNGRRIGLAHYKNKTPLTLARLPHQGTFVHKRVYEKYGRYSLGFKIRMDYEFFARIVLLIEPKLINKVIVRYDNTGVSSSLKNKIRFEIEGIIVEFLYFKKSIFRIIYLPFLRFFKSMIGVYLRRLGMRK